MIADRYAEARASLEHSILETHGDSQPTLRRDIESHAAGLSGLARKPGSHLPSDLVPYIEKVAKHAYKTTDEDLQRLRDVGYSEDAIFEATLSAALGAAIARYERGRAALSEGRS